MRKIEKVVILGAGAMGSYFVSRFFDTEGLSTALLARGERYERLRRDGLVVNDKAYYVPVLHPDRVDAPADLIIVALKHHHLKRAMPDLKNLVGSETEIISVMNGLDSEAYIGEIYGMDKVLYTISVGIDAVREGNRLTYTQPGKNWFGEAVNHKISDRVGRVQKAFDQAGIVHETPVDMIRMLWWKFMINVGMNQASAAMRAPYGVFQKTHAARDLMETLMREVITLAEHARVDLTGTDITDWYTVLDTLSPQGKTSMLQDVEAGRKTEIEIFGGKVVALGQTYGIPTPVNETLVRIIQVLETDMDE